MLPSYRRVVNDVKDRARGLRGKCATLKTAARRKSEEKTRSADAAIARLTKRGEPVTFQAVQREAGVSHAFLYNNQQLRARIEHQRRQRRPATDPVSTNSDNDNNDNNNIISALTAEVARLKTQYRKEVQALRDALEQAHGENLELRRELQRRGRIDQPARSDCPVQG